MGTRPEAIKLAPVVRSLRADPRFETIVVATGQHRQMFDDTLVELGLTADIDLDIQRNDGSLAELTAKVLASLDMALHRLRPDAIVVQGDTTTAMAAGLAAAYQQVPLIHVEAGLRSGRRTSPFPEETNRRIIALVADLHLAPTSGAMQNLVAEGVLPSDITVVGNTVVDAIFHALSTARPTSDPYMSMIDSDPRRVLLFTAHRRESWGEAMTSVATTVAAAANIYSDMLVVAAIHQNPIVRDLLLPALNGLSNVVIVPPLPYNSFIKLMTRAQVILTDSGGTQEEAVTLGTPTLVLRNVTERPEALAHGSARLVGTDPEQIAGELHRIWTDEAHRQTMSQPSQVFGDGRAAERCVEAIAYHLGIQHQPPKGFRFGTAPHDRTMFELIEMNRCAA